MGKKTNYLGPFVQNIGSILSDAFSNIVLKKALSFFAENVTSFRSAKAPHIFWQNILVHLKLHVLEKLMTNNALNNWALKLDTHISLRLP